ncbi:MAG TPA: TcpE family conjugal transfer membrane protein [Streptosporangiaceae bacterium]
MDLPTYTNIWRIEKRLYKLYDFRLPMPLPLGQIAVFTAIAVPYVVILAVLGVPFSHTLLWLYVLPPGVLAWFATRPVLEGKRLPELVASQVRYLSEPRTWCRMAPLVEPDDVLLTARVWRRHRPVLALDDPFAWHAEQEEAAGGRAVTALTATGQARPAIAAAARPLATAGSGGRPAPPAAPQGPRAPGPRRQRSRPPRRRRPALPPAARLPEAVQPDRAYPDSPAPDSPAPGGTVPFGTAAGGIATGSPARDRAFPDRAVPARGAPAGRRPEWPAASGPTVTPAARTPLSPVGPGPDAPAGHPAVRPERPGLAVPAAAAPAARTPVIKGGDVAASAADGAVSAADDPVQGAPGATAGPAEQRGRMVQQGPPAPQELSAEQESSAQRELSARQAPAQERERAEEREQPEERALPVVTVREDRSAERPLRVVGRALGSPTQRRAEGWRDRVVVVPGGHRPGQPDLLQRDRARARLAFAGPRRIVVLGCTVGAGQTVTTLRAGEMLAILRDEPVAVLDLNPGKNSLLERARHDPALNPPDRHAAATAPVRLEVITAPADESGRASQADRAFELMSARYSLTLADPAAAEVPRVLPAAHQLVLVAPASSDAAGAIAMTLEWLEAHGHAALAGAAITVLNGVSKQSLGFVEQAEAVATGRCRAIVRVPWDDQSKYQAPERHTALDPAGQPQRPASGPAERAYTALAGVLVAGLITAPELPEATS